MDVSFTKAKLAIDYKYCRPVINNKAKKSFVMGSVLETIMAQILYG